MQAPVGPATTPELVAAVSGLGCLGTLAASWTDPQALRERIRAVRAAVDEPFCVNLVLAFDQRERLRAVLEEGVGLVSFAWGIDRELIEQAHDGHARVLVQVGDVTEASMAVAAGADVLIVQGIEAGGHVQGHGPLLDLLRTIRPAVQVPIVAAGGIGDAAAAAQALAAGADGYACGTVFLAATEANVHPLYLDRLIAADASDTELTTMFDGGWPDAPHRLLRNSTFESSTEPKRRDVIAGRRGVAIERYSSAQPTRETTGDVEAMAMYAGTSVGCVTRSEPAADIARRLSS